MNMQVSLRGKPIRLAVLDYGLFEVYAGPRTIGICGFVIQTDRDETILIDTGFPQKYADDAEAATREDDLGSFGRVLDVGPQNMPGPQLALLGIDKSDVTLMIQSHTHIDHVGDMAGYPQAPILIAAAERELPRPLYWSGKQAMTWPDRDYVLVTGDFELGTGFEVLLCRTDQPSRSQPLEPQRLGDRPGRDAAGIHTRDRRRAGTVPFKTGIDFVDQQPRAHLVGNGN